MRPQLPSGNFIVNIYDYNNFWLKKIFIKKFLRNVYSMSIYVKALRVIGLSKGISISYVTLVPCL